MTKNTQDEISDKTALQQNYERVTIKGFDWIELNDSTKKEQDVKKAGFQRFTFVDEKKKWKKKNCQSFQGFGNRIQKILQANKRLKNQNISKLKQQVFNKTLKHIELKNKVEQIHKIQRISQIYQQQKNYRTTAINNYFDQQIQLIRKKAL